MKIRILTQPLGHNIGGILQNYALMMACKEYSGDVKTLDVTIPPPIIFPLLKYGSCIKRLFLKFFVDRKTIVRWWLEEKKEEKKLYVPQESELIRLNLRKKNLRMYTKESIVVFGSDQVWRKDMSLDIMTFFGAFLRGNVSRIAYAASFGVDYWQFDKSETKKIISFLKKFKAISVREESAVHLLRERGIEAQLVLDPTLLLQRDDYLGLETATSCRFADRAHAFLYCLDKHSGQDEAVSLVRERMKMPVMDIAKNLQIDCWISGLRTAECVITDSFHGTIFSIIFHKKFIVVANEQRGVTRLQSLLKMIGLEDHLVMSFDDFNCDVLNAEIDYKRVDVILNREREKSTDFLRKNLSC